jgi:hypothetical protein
MMVGERSMRWARFVAIVQFLLLVSMMPLQIVVMQPASASHLSWSIETLDGAGSDRTGYYSSIAVDFGRNPHISYYYNTGRDLMYATKKTGQWTLEALDTAGAVGSWTSIPLDSNGYPHISYTDRDGEHLKYAAKTPVPPFTLIETVDTQSSMADTSIAVDKTNRPHIAYASRPFPGADPVLRYAVRDSGTWSMEEIYTGLTDWDVSLNLDGAGNPHIIFLDKHENINSLLHAYKTAGTWNIETAIQGSNPASAFSSAIDSWDNIHVSYVERFDDVKYAVKRGGVWSNETIGHPGIDTTFNDIAVDLLGNPHVCYTNHSYADPNMYHLTYATKRGGVWVRETVDSNDHTGGSCSIAVDQLHIPHISYADYYNANLKYATVVGGVWEVEIADKGIEDDVGRYTSIKLDSSGMPHISYLDDTFGDLKYMAEISPGIWSRDRVDVLGETGAGSSIALDSTGRPHFGFFDMTNQGLKYACGPGWKWFNETVDSSPGAGVNTSIAVGPGDSVYIAYYDMTKGDLMFATNTSTGWNIESVDSIGNVGLYPSLVVDPGGRAHLSYYDASGGDLKYAVKEAGSWTLETIDSTGDVGQWTSIALDSTGEPLVSYHDSDNGDLRLASHEGGAWSLLTIDSTGDVGLFSSLAIGPDGVAHVAHYDRTRRDLRYASNLSGSWESEIVSSAGTVGEYPSIAVDLAGNAYISYYDRTAGNLNLAFGELRPDLVITRDDITTIPSSPVGNGTTVTIAATVTNLGYKDAYMVYVRFFDGDPALGRMIGGDILLPPVRSAGGRETAYTQWVAGPIGDHDICVVVDPDNTVTELNETNNMACLPVDVLSLPPARAPTILSANLSGMDFENVTITWSLSPDDGAGQNSVVGYSIYMGATYDVNAAGYQPVAVVPGGTFEYNDSLTGEGDPSNYFYQICAVDLNNLTNCSANQAGKFTRSLLNGQNLVSIPLIQSDRNIETVLQTVKRDKAWTYDSSAQKWKSHTFLKPYKGELDEVNVTGGIWVNVTEQSNLTVAGLMPTITSIHLHAGWNLVSFPSFNATYAVSDLKASVGVERIEGFDALAPPYNLKVMLSGDVLQTGFGYWVRVLGEAIWVVDNT